MTVVKPRCRCWWHHVPCQKEATQEDGLCDWCGDRRAEDMANNPSALWSPDGEYLGLGGGRDSGYNHQAGWGEIPDSVRPTACWMPDSGRVLVDLSKPPPGPASPPRPKSYRPVA